MTYHLNIINLKNHHILHLSDIMIMVVVVCAPILLVILFKHPDLRSINEIEVDIKSSPDRIGRLHTQIQTCDKIIVEGVLNYYFTFPI